MNTYSVWNLRSLIGVDEKCLKNKDGNYVGIKTGNLYDSLEFYSSEQFDAIIIDVDSINQTGMYHLSEEAGNGENRAGWKRKFVGCRVTVEKAHKNGELTIYRVRELEEYFSSNEIKIIT